MLTGLRALPLVGRTAGQLYEMAWLILVVAIPLAVNPWGVQAFDLPKVALLRTVIIGLLAMWLWQRRSAGLPLLTHWHRISWGDPRVWAGACCLALVAATATSVDVGLSLWGSHSHQEGLFTLLAYMLLFGLVATQVRSQRQAERLAFAVALGPVPIVAYGLMQGAGLDPVPWHTSDKSSAI